MPDIMHGLERLLEIYPRPRQAPAETVDFAKMWFRELSDLDVEAFRAGVSSYCKTAARYFPTPGEIRNLGELVRLEGAPAVGLKADYARWEREWPEAPLSNPLPCPVCGATDTWADGKALALTVRRKVLHDDVKHTEAGIGFIGWAQL